MTPPERLGISDFEFCSMTFFPWVLWTTICLFKGHTRWFHKDCYTGDIGGITPIILILGFLSNHLFFNIFPLFGFWVWCGLWTAYVFFTVFV